MSLYFYLAEIGPIPRSYFKFQDLALQDPMQLQEKHSRPRRNADRKPIRPISRTKRVTCTPSSMKSRYLPHSSRGWEDLWDAVTLNTSWWGCQVLMGGTCRSLSETCRCLQHGREAPGQTHSSQIGWNQPWAFPTCCKRVRPECTF